jgi:formylglycine-generating enzyme required for sulfatase activity
MGIYLVTNELFLQFVQNRGYESDDSFWKGVPSQSKATFLCQDGKTYGPSTWPSKAGFLEGRAHHPVAGISYYEALAFCRWLQKINPLEDGCQWCLPTENMWELVARPEKGFLYPWGLTFEPDRCNSVEAKVGITTEVGRFQNGKSKTGCFDMAGNVWEFVREDEDEHWYCVLRGGSYRNNEHQVKSSLRLWGVPRDHRPPDFGFRCALVRNSA